MKKTIEKTVWTIDDPELPESVKRKILKKHSDINAAYAWWELTYVCALDIGLKITSFDNHKATGKLTRDATTVCDLIMATHGETCDTYKLAKAFWIDHDELICKAPRDENGGFEDERELDSQLDDLEMDFTRALLEEYFIILQKEYEHLTSEESVLETLQANAYYFDEKGDIV